MKNKILWVAIFLFTSTLVNAKNFIISSNCSDNATYQVIDSTSSKVLEQGLIAPSSEKVIKLTLIQPQGVYGKNIKISYQVNKQQQSILFLFDKGQMCNNQKCVETHFAKGNAPFGINLPGCNKI